MVLEILEEEIREVIHELFTRTKLNERESPLREEDLECCASAGQRKSQRSISDIVTSKEFHVHIADFVDCVTGNLKLLDLVYIMCDTRCA